MNETKKREEEPLSKGIITYIPIQDLLNGISDVVRKENLKLLDYLDDQDELLKVPDACKLLDVTRQTLRAWEKSQGLEPLHINSRKYYLKSSIMNLLKSKK